MEFLMQFLILATLLLHQGLAQLTPTTEVYRSDFNSSFKLTPSQIGQSQLPDSLVNSIENFITSQRSQYAFGGVDQDDFYTITIPNNTSIDSLQPGQILKVQLVTDTSAYALPPGTALSRIIYTTTKVNGTVIPTSGYILWPFMPRVFRSSRAHSNRPPKANVVLWAHGTSGVFAPNAPSANRFLQYWHTTPYPLAQAGYVVFAPDYAGLGVRYFLDGQSQIAHQYFVSPAGARDALYGLRAVFSEPAFKNILSGEYVIMGHSQGGGVAWSAAELLAASSSSLNNGSLNLEDLIPGYKGSIALAPATSMFANPPFTLPAVAQAVSSIYPSFNLSDWLTPLGVARLNLAKELQGEISLFGNLFASDEKGINSTIRPDFYETSWYPKSLEKIANVGGRDFLGPMLVLQGGGDFLVPESLTAAAVRSTEQFVAGLREGKGKGKDKLKNRDRRDLEYVVAKGVGHTPILDVARTVWMDWIEDRFSGKEVAQKGFVRREFESFLDWDRYAKVLNSVLLWAGLPQFGYLVLGAA